jgi:hypothetical protein
VLPDVENVGEDRLVAEFAGHSALLPDADTRCGADRRRCRSPRQKRS